MFRLFSGVFFFIPINNVAVTTLSSYLRELLQLYPQDKFPEVKFPSQRVCTFLRYVPSRKIYQFALLSTVFGGTGFPLLTWVKCHLKKKNTAESSRISLLSIARFLKGHRSSLNHVSIFFYLQGGKLLLLTLPASWDISNVNHLGLQETRPVIGENPLRFLNVWCVGVTERPAPDEMLPSLYKIKRCKKIPSADCQDLS